MAKRHGSGNISGTLRADQNEAGNILENLKVAYKAIEPKQMYLMKGMWRQMVFENGTRVDLHPNDGCVVIMVLSGEQAAGFEKGLTDVF